jgi:hypothetical protein
MLSGIALKVVFFWQSHSVRTHKTNAYCIHDINTVFTDLHIFTLAMFFHSFFFSVLKKKYRECLSPYIDIAMSDLFLLSAYYLINWNVQWEATDEWTSVPLSTRCSDNSHELSKHKVHWSHFKNLPLNIIYRLVKTATNYTPDINFTIHSLRHIWVSYFLHGNFKETDFIVTKFALQTTDTVVVPSSCFNFSTTGLVFKFFALFMKNILFEQRKIKLWSKRQFVENETEIMQHGLKM